MRVNLPLANILHSLPRTVVSLSGIGIAIVLIFVQLGFRGAVCNTALMIFEKMDFDLMVRSRDYLHFVNSGTVPLDRLQIAHSAAGVGSVTPFCVALVNWRNPHNADLRGLVLMGIAPGSPSFRDPAVTADLPKLTGADQILVDVESSAEFGPANGKRFSAEDLGVGTEVAGRPVRIAGFYRMGAGLTANGSAIVSADGFARIVPWDSRQHPSFGLVKLAPGRSAGEVAAAIEGLTRDGSGEPTVEVLTRAEVMDRELSRWLNETPIGFVFTLGVATAFVVGAAIFYMVLSTDVSNRLHEYATLRAMGYPGVFLAGTVLRQAFWLALLAFVPALLFSLAFYRITSLLANLPVSMTTDRLLFVFLLTQLMCGLSGALALRKLWNAEPASLF